jgi:predicted DCC family thiol-disulfide oxidoreductase YuxK
VCWRKLCACCNPLLRPPGRRCGRAPDDLSSIVLVEEGGHHTRSDAIINIYSRLPMPAPLIAGAIRVLPQGLRDALYNQVCVDSRGCSMQAKTKGSARIIQKSAGWALPCTEMRVCVKA